MKLPNSCQSVKFVSGVFLTLLFFGALFWAKEQDPFSRKWFTLKTADHNFVKCVAVFPKPLRQCPVIIYAHGSGGTLMNDGNDLRQMAELGFATVSLEYNQTNEAVFDSQFETLLHYLDRQKWADKNAIAWVGFSLGANRMLNFVLQHPAQQPQLLVQLSGAGTELSTTNSQLLTILHCPALLIHSDKDEIFPVADTKRLASVLQTNGLPVELKIIPDVPHGMEPERGVVFRSIGEYCLTYLSSTNAWQNYRSIAQRQSEAPPFWCFCLPTTAWITGWFVWWRCHRSAPPEKVKLTRSEIALRWLAVILATWASLETAIHLATPYFSVSDKTLAIARKFLVPPKEQNDFEWLAAKPVWQNQKLKILLEHVELANYNRELINWQLDDKMYRDYVLSPEIKLSTNDPQLSTDLNWRRLLWEEFYPRIRHESSPEDAARIVVRHLRERVTIAASPNLSHDVPTIWRKQITDEIGFQIIYVAALRSTGVPARLDPNQHAEFWTGEKWQMESASIDFNHEQ
jgi:acetyl esterase/lipase